MSTETAKKKVSFQQINAYNKRYILLLCGLVIGTIGVFVTQSRWGLQGLYYTNPQWQGEPIVSRIDCRPLLKDKEGDNLLSTDDYSVKWSGWIAINQSGTYKFATNSDDGSYLRINGETIVDNGGTHGLNKVLQEIALKKGVYPIEVLYFQAGGHSIMQTLWTPPEKPEELIPAAILFSKRPGRADILFRKGVILLSGILKVIWGSLFVFITLILLTKILQSEIVAHVKRKGKIFSRNNCVPLGLAGFFLGGILLTVYASKYPLVEQSSGSDWTVYANYNAHDARLAIDRRPETRWTTKQAMKPGMFFQIDLERSTRIERITLFHGQSVNDYPQGYRIEVSHDGINWAAANLQDCQKFPDRTEIYINPAETQHIKITQTWYNNQNYWSIHELYLYRPSWLPRSYQYPLILLLFCGLVGSALFIGLSCWSAFQTCGRLILIGLVLAIIFGFFLRIFMLSYHDIHPDESAYLNNAMNHIDSDRTWLQNALETDITRSPILHLLACRWLFRITYNSALAIRLMSAVLGTFTILLVFFVWRRISSRKEACFEAFLSAAMLSPLVYHVCWSRDGHGEINMTFFYILYIFVACQALPGYPRRKRLFFWSGTLLFLGFFFHGTMFIAPFGIFIFALLDLLLTRSRLPQWQNGGVKNYLPLFLSGLLFFGYVYYLLVVKGAIADVETGGANIPTRFGSLAPFINFLKVRWQSFVENLTSAWWESYGFPKYFSITLKGLALLGMIDVIFRRQKKEWFLLLQPVFFCVMVSFLVSSSNFERHFHPFVLTLTCLVARGINIIATCFKTHWYVTISRLMISTAVVLYLSFISVYGIFLEQPQYHKQFSWVYRVYGGRASSFFRILTYVKKSERGANAIICTDWWRFSHYATMFKLNIRFIDPQNLVEMIAKQQLLPVFVIVDAAQQRQDWQLLDTLEGRYNLVGTAGNSLYELRGDVQPGQKSQLSPIVLTPQLMPTKKSRLRSTPVQLSKDEIVKLFQENDLHHPDDLSQYGLFPRMIGTFQHDYEVALFNGETVVIDHATGLMWQQSGASEHKNWKTLGWYINQLNQERYAGFSDWRLPTIEELASLLEPTFNKEDLYIDPVFDGTQRWCWSADRVKDSLNTAWIVHFYHGNIAFRSTSALFHVRAVRSIQ